MAKMSKKIPKRATNDKLKLKRARSFNKNQQDKSMRKLRQDMREIANRQRGFTGKQLDNAARKAFGKDYRKYKRAVDAGLCEFTTLIDGALSATRVTVTGVRSLA